MGYNWDFLYILHYIPELLDGGLNTLKLLVSALIIAVPLGLTLGILRQQKVPILGWLAVLYIDFFRSSVALVLIYWCYFALPIVVGVAINTYLAVTLALGLQAAAFMAEIVRGGITSISRGQWEAARALGMRKMTCMRYVILPQAYRRMIPIFFLLVVEVIKNTALAGVVTYKELFYVAFNVSSETYKSLETFTIVGLIYFVVIYGASSLSRLLERKMASR
ncbi:amino acid ABC transporter permease [Ferrovibrio xuzhouensis]|uniref:Amino acid ABC transporter permease n=1 Tax=Ferrovibrio xuzhouensis TaxID=1576914 RepID=A0ABV7VN36_9PROT